MGLLIGISGGNHVLHRSLINACEKAGHRAVIVDEPPQSSLDAVIVVDSTLVPVGPASGDVSGKPPIDLPASRTVFVRPIAQREAPAREHSSTNDGAIVVRTPPVYGISTDPITVCLILMRSLPAVPVLSDARASQPVWHEDLAQVMVSAATLPVLPSQRVFDIAGPEAVTPEELYERIAALIDRRPARIPVPEFVARHGSRAAEVLGVSGAILPMLEAFSAGHLAPDENALERVFGVPPTSLDSGLRRLIRDLDEVTPAQGVGSVQIKRFFADIEGAALPPAELLHLLRERFGEIMPMPVGVEPAAPATRLEPGAVVTIALPGRGHVQIRVREITDEHVIVATLRGHAVAGIVRFSATGQSGIVRFEVSTCDAAANALDWLTLSLGGARMQDANWMRVVSKMAELSGGRSDGVTSEIRTLDARQAAEADRWIRDIIEQDRSSA
jgi:hypothetical protein